MRTSWTTAAIALLALGCGASPTDIEELKKGQKDILTKLEGLDKTVQQIKAAPAPAQRPQLDPNKVYTIPTGGSPVRGAKDAKVTIVEFADYQCPFCAQAAPLFEQVLKEYPKDVNYVYKQFPLPATMHPNAMPASKAVVAAGKQGKVWEMHDLVFQNSRELGADKLKEYAGRVGVDVARWEKDMNSPEVQQQIDREMAEGRAADVTGTPTIFVNGKRLQNRSIEGFRQMIDEATGAKQG
jgi:protein-disulfide isomerase